MNSKLQLTNRQLIDELEELPILQLTEELKQLTKEFIVDYLIDKLTPEVTVYNSTKSVFKSLPPPISLKEIQILSLYDAGNYNRTVIKDIRGRGHLLNPIQEYILNHKKIYEETLNIESDSIKLNTNKVLNDMGFPGCLHDITKDRRDVLLKQYNIIQVYNQSGLEKVKKAEEVANRKEASEQLIQSNLEKDKERKMREEKQTREDGRNLIEGIRKEEEAAKAKRDLEELERKKFLSSSQPQPQIKSQEELANEERIRTEAERKRLNDDIRRQEKHERDVAQGLVSSGPDSFSGPSLGRPNEDSYNTAKNKQKNTNSDALLAAVKYIPKVAIDNFTLTVIDQIDKQIGIFVFWTEVIRESFERDRRQCLLTVQNSTIRMYKTYKEKIDQQNKINIDQTEITTNTFDEYKTEIACIIHEYQFQILDNAMKETINNNELQLSSTEIISMQKCIAILLYLTPRAFFIDKVFMDTPYTNENAKKLNKDLVKMVWNKRDDTVLKNSAYLYGATVRFTLYQNDEKPWYISDASKYDFGVKDCYRAIKDTGTFTNDPKGFANIKKWMEGLSKQQNLNYFFTDFPDKTKHQEIYKTLTYKTDNIFFIDFFKLNAEIPIEEGVQDTSNNRILQLVKNNDPIEVMRTHITRVVQAQYTTALLVYIRDERSKCSYIGTYRLTGKKPKGGRKTRRQRRTKQRKYKDKGQKKTRKQRRKKTQKRRSKK